MHVKTQRRHLTSWPEQADKFADAMQHELDGERRQQNTEHARNERESHRDEASDQSLSPRADHEA
jgi:hypothetical protein